MKVVFICSAGLVSGKERQTLGLMSELRRRGHHIHCVVSSWSSGAFLKLLQAENIPHSRMRIGFISKSLNWPAIRMSLHQLIYVPSLWRDYRHLIRTFRPDAVVHTNFHHLFLLLPVLGATKQVFHVHDFFSPGRFMKRLFRSFNKQVSAFIGVSKFICDSLPVLGVSPEKVKLVYNGVVLEGSNTNETTGDDMVVGIVGQIGPWKGHEVLLRALAAVGSLRWKLHVIGEGPEPFVTFLKDLSAELGISSRIEFKGSVAGLENIYRGLNIVCVPSTSPESFGLAAVEPGFFGIPVICTSVGALPEVVQHKVTGLVVPPGDVVALSASLQLLILEREVRSSLGAAAIIRVSELFRMDNTAKAFEKELEKLW
jgi:glycosyltransferase involved in cell wall biosynthesis